MDKTNERMNNGNTQPIAEIDEGDTQQLQTKSL